MGAGDWTQVPKLERQMLYWQSHLPSPHFDAFSPNLSFPDDSFAIIYFTYILYICEFCLNTCVFTMFKSAAWVQMEALGTLELEL